MKLRMPFLLWMLFQSTMGIYATNCTHIADSLYKVGKTYESELRASTDAKLQKELETKAIDAYSKAFDVALEDACKEQFRTLKDAKSLYSLALKALVLKKREKAIGLFQGALAIRKDSLDSGDANILKCYANLSMANRQVLQFEEAELFIEESLKELDKWEGTSNKTHKNAKAYLYHEAAQLYIDMGDPSKALPFNMVAWKTYGEIKKYKSQINSGNQRGVIFEKIKASKEGIQHLKEVERLSKELQNSYKIKKIYLGLGNMYFLEELYTDALSYFQLAVSESENDPYTKADCLGNIGLIYRKIGQFPQALENYNSAINLDLLHAGEIKRKVVLANNYSGLGEVYRDINRFDEAIISHGKSIDLLLEGYKEKDEYSLPNLKKVKILGSPRFLIESLSVKAETFFQKYLQKGNIVDLDAAGNNYLLAIQLIDEFRTNYQEDKSKLFLMNDVYATYEGAIKVATYQNNPTYAFQLAEKAKATLLYASMMDKEAKTFANIPPEALALEQDLKREIATLEQKRETLSSDEKNDQIILDELLAKKRDLQELIEDFGKKYPDYYRLKYDTELVNVDEIQARLPDSTLMIEYFAGNESWFVFAISKAGIQVRALENKRDEIKEFAALIPRTESWTTKINPDEKALFNCLGFSLYQELIKPVLKEKDIKYAIIIPDKEIYYVPFDALLTEIPAEKRPISLYPFALHTLAMSYDFSAKVWLKGLTKKSSGSWFQKSLLAFAPDFNTLSPEAMDSEEKSLLDLDFFKGRREPDSLAQLNPLTESKDEVRVIRDLLGGNVYPDEEKPGLLGRFIKEAPKYRFIHLGTHGIFNKYNSKYSYLAFQPVEDGIDNERLYLADIHSLNLDADMVVLSACETQAGELLPGEGIASLAQGFSYAGARSIVATLWSVQNASNSKLMKRFYEYLIEGNNKALALQKAKISMNKEGASFGPPFYWAAPNVIGSTAPINTPYPWQRYLLMTLSLAIMGGMGMFFVKKDSFK